MPRVFSNPNIQLSLGSKKIAAALTAKVDPAVLVRSKTKAAALVTSIKGRVVTTKRTRFETLKKSRGNALRSVVKSRAMRKPEQIIAAFVTRIKVARRLVKPAGSHARLLIRSPHADIMQIIKPLTILLGSDPTLLGITVKKITQKKSPISSYSVIFPIDHRSVRTELLNVAWALRRSGQFQSVAVSGLKGIFCAPTAATRAERSFSWNLDLTRTTRAHLLTPKPGGRRLGEGITIAHIDTGWADHSQYNVAQINQRLSHNVITGATGGDNAKHSILNRDAGSMNITHGTATGSVVLGGKVDDGQELLSTVTDKELQFKTDSDGKRQYDNNVRVLDPNGHLTGVAPKATVLPIKFISDQALLEIPARGVEGVGVFRLFDDDLIAAIEYAIQVNADVITLSVGGLLHDDVREVIDRAVRDHHMIITAAVGQTYASNAVSGVADALNVVGIGGGDSVILPAAYSNVMAVAGCSPSGAPWNESHRGPNVDITAPADAVWIADYASPDGRSGGATRREILECASGTSFAAPLVAGAAALWLAHHGKQTLLNTYRSAGIPLAWVFRQLVQSTARPIGDWDDGLYGPGVIDVEALLNAELPAPANVIPPPPMVNGVVPGVSGMIEAGNDAMLEFMDWLGTQAGNAQREAAVMWLAGQEAINRTVTTLGDAWAQLDAAAQGAAADLQAEINNAKKDLEKGMNDLLNQAEESLNEAGKQADDAVDEAGKAIEEFSDNVGEAASDVVDAVASFFGW